MNPIPLPIANGFYRSESLPVSAQDCVNFYPVVLEAPGLNQEILFGCPGIELLGTSGAESSDLNRGSIKLGDVPYFVNGNALYRQNADLSIDEIGEIEGSGRVSMASNGTQIMIIASGLNEYPYVKGYTFTDDGGDFLGEIVDDDFYANGNPTHVRFVDGYFLATTDTKKFIISDLNDGSTWNALDVGTAESDPDIVMVPEILNNQPYIFGTETAEAFSNQPVGADFPFVRTGTFLDKGTKAPWSVIKTQSRIYFVGGGKGESHSVYEYGGGSEATKISTEGIDSILQRLTDDELADIFAWSYAQKGFFFVGFTLPSTTIVYETRTGRWHERKSFVTFQDGTTSYTRWRVNSIVQAYGKLIVGDMVDGRLGSLDIDIYDEYGANIRRRAATQPFQNNMVSFRIPHLELTMESGVGNADDPDPMVTMSRSTNGRTWTDPRARSIGAIGEYGRRQIWRRLGRASRFELFAFEVTAKVKVVIIQLTAEILPGFR